MENDGKNRILKLFFENSFREYYLREIAKNANMPVDNAHRYLHEFVKTDFLKIRKTKKKTFFIANLENEFLLKNFEYFELERREEFFIQNPSLSKLKDIAKDVLTLVWEPAMILYEKSKSEILLVTPRASEKLSGSGVVKTITLHEFKKMNRDVVLKDHILLYNEFLFWREIRKMQN